MLGLNNNSPHQSHVNILILGIFLYYLMGRGGMMFMSMYKYHRVVYFGPIDFALLALIFYLAYANNFED